MATALLLRTNSFRIKWKWKRSCVNIPFFHSICTTLGLLPLRRFAFVLFKQWKYNYVNKFSSFLFYKSFSFLSDLFVIFHMWSSQEMLSGLRWSYAVELKEKLKQMPLENCEMVKMLQCVQHLQKASVTKNELFCAVISHFA